MCEDYSSSSQLLYSKDASSLIKDLFDDYQTMILSNTRTNQNDTVLEQVALCPINNLLPLLRRALVYDQVL